MLVGPESEDGQHRWYFSLNNRRLWVLKRCREEGLLQDTKNEVLVRIREPKSQSEKKRYTIQNCALEAKLMPERGKKDMSLKEDTRLIDGDANDAAAFAVKETAFEIPDQKDDDDDNHNDDSTDDSVHDCYGKNKVERNRFKALF